MSPAEERADSIPHSRERGEQEGRHEARTNANANCLTDAWSHGADQAGWNGVRLHNSSRCRAKTGVSDDRESNTFYYGVDRIKKYDTGGFVDAPRGSAVSAIVHGGEYVMPASKVDRSRSGGGASYRGGVTVSVGEINVYGNDDPRATAVAVREEILRQSRRYGDPWNN